MDARVAQTMEVQVKFMGDMPSILGKRQLQVAMPQEATAASASLLERVME